MNQPTVYIILLNWNNWKDTLECLHSCRKLQYANYTTVVVDNGSRDNSTSKLEGTYPDQIVIETGRNLGFAGGNNVGIEYALEKGADYIWLLNNDTIVDPEALSELVKTAELGQNIGIVGSKILTCSDPSIIHFAGGKVDLRTGDTFHIGEWEKDLGQFDDLSEVDYVTGCSMLIRKETIEKIGLMPEEYFLYYEETDWCLRAKNLGYNLRMAQNSRVHHKISSSVNEISEAKIYYLTRNRLYFLKKYGENVSWARRIVKDLKNSFYLLSNKDYSTAFIIFKSYYHWLSKYQGQII